MSKKKDKLKRAAERQQNPQAAQLKSKTKYQPVSNKQHWFIGLLIVLITFLVFIPALSLHFVNWDDPNNLLENESLKTFSYEWNWAAVKTIFTSDVIGNYNPLPVFSFAIEKYFFAQDPVANPFIFHLTNVWMHLICTLMVFFLFSKLGLNKTASFAGALLFGIHPMRVESVAWVTERKDVLYGLFFLASLITYLNYVQHEKGKTKWYVVTLLLSVLSYFSKVQAVTLPLTMVAIDFFMKRKWSSPKILIAEKLPWWILSLVFGLINIYFLRQQKSIDVDDPVLAYSFVDRLAVGSLSYATYLAKLIYPYLMSPLYPYPKKLPAEAYAALVIVPIAVIAFLVWAFKNKKTTLIFAWAFFTFNVMFLLQILAAGQGFLADRFTYIAYVGLFFLLAKGYEWVIQNKPQMKMGVNVFAGLYLLLFIFLTDKQIKIWQNGGTLWEYVKSTFPDNTTAWGNGAFYYREEEKDFAKAIEYYTKSISLDPDRSAVYNSLAKTYFDWSLATDIKTPAGITERNRLAQLAIESYVNAERQDSIAGKKEAKTTGEIIINKGAAYALVGNLDASLNELTRGLAIDPKNANGYLNRSLIYINRNQNELAIKDYDSYLEIKPYNSDIYYERGVCKNRLQKFKESIADFDKAISMKNTQPLYFIERARAYKATGNALGAKNDIAQVQRMGGKVPPDLLQ